MEQRAQFNLLPGIIVIMMAVALVIFAPALKRSHPWSGWFASHAERASTVGRVKVWVNPRSGLYYCSPSSLYGKMTPGRYMVQSDALQSGYRPAEEEPCH
jgi:hypothetical protein